MARTWSRAREALLLVASACSAVRAVVVTPVLIVAVSGEAETTPWPVTVMVLVIDCATVSKENCSTAQRERSNSGVDIMLSGEFEYWRQYQSE